MTTAIEKEKAKHASKGVEHWKIGLLDEFDITILSNSKIEVTAYLLTILTPLLLEGCKDIFQKSLQMTQQSKVPKFYLQTFQNCLPQIKKWSRETVLKECKRIREKVTIGHLDELLTLVHLSHLKMLNALRVSSNQKKIDLPIPSLEEFIHQIYIELARVLYTNAYLFDMSIPSMEKQKHMRDLEILVRECILKTVRNGIPIDLMVKSLLGEDMEEEIIEEIIEMPAPPPPPSSPSPSYSANSLSPSSTQMPFPKIAPNPSPPIPDTDEKVVAIHRSPSLSPSSSSFPAAVEEMQWTQNNTPIASPLLPAHLSPPITPFEFEPIFEPVARTAVSPGLQLMEFADPADGELDLLPFPE